MTTAMTDFIIALNNRLSPKAKIELPLTEEQKAALWRLHGQVFPDIPPASADEEQARMDKMTQAVKAIEANGGLGDLTFGE